MTTDTAIDYTKLRKGSKPYGRPIDVCPKCDRKGQRTTYDGLTMYAHFGHTSPLGFIVIDEHCVVPAEPK